MAYPMLCSYPLFKSHTIHEITSNNMNETVNFQSIRYI